MSPLVEKIGKIESEGFYNSSLVLEELEGVVALGRAITNPVSNKGNRGRTQNLFPSIPSERLNLHDQPHYLLRSKHSTMGFYEVGVEGGLM